MCKLTNVPLAMREYQKNNNVKGQCVTNVMTLYDILKQNTTFEIKVKSVYVISGDNDTCFICAGHLVIEVEGTICETSYDIYSLKDRLYFDNFKLVLDNIPSIDKETKKNVLMNYRLFKSYSDRINNGEFFIVDKTYYNKQIDFIENYK
tara:strand:+ start:119 stop:565 length:447 start_codon:yes stop_codon:yes gene_type:complete